MSIRLIYFSCKDDHISIRLMSVIRMTTCPLDLYMSVVRMTTCSLDLYVSYQDEHISIRLICPLSG